MLIVDPLGDYFDDLLELFILKSFAGDQLLLQSHLQVAERSQQEVLGLLHFTSIKVD